VLTGTVLYRDLDHDLRARHSLECASRVVVLQAEGLVRLDAATRTKAVVIVQSASAVKATRAPDDAEFVAVGHLRAEKDPETLMRAARLLAAEGHAPTIAHIGGALDPRLGDEARATSAACPGYRWLGALPHAAARRDAWARALVHPSVAERRQRRRRAGALGRAGAVSRIDGNVGLLGADYDGSVGDAAAGGADASLRATLPSPRICGRSARARAAVPAGCERRAARSGSAALPARRRAR
jgi:hypothetical protein